MNRAILLLVAAMAMPALAQRGLQHIPDPDVSKQIETFKLADGFEINLFAADPMLAKPIQMNWDPAGRLWIASSSMYPQIIPGEIASDSVIVLEDTTGDGAADKRTVFAEGLLIPTAVMPYRSGVYVANSTELLFLDDTDGDGKADTRQVVLSGFGSEDTHHILHTFRWGPDGNMYMNQSIYIHSHVETPYGPRRLGAGGTWQFNPETLRLEIMTRGFINHWGHHFDRWGQSFASDGAGSEGVNYMFPGSKHHTAHGARRTLNGFNPGQPKIAGLAVLSGRHLPEAWRGNIIGHDFRGHRSARFIISDDGSAYASRRVDDLVSSSHGSFRPVDVKMGPDGAIYIADWYNPIIQHGEVDFRDPRRDHTHGRIWRITAKDRPLVDKPKLVDASVTALLDALKAPEQWTREQAKRVLNDHNQADVIKRTKAWVDSLDKQDPEHAHHLLEAAWVLLSHNTVDPTLIQRIVDSNEPRAFAAVIRILKTWSLDNAPAYDEAWFPAIREKAITHDYGRVRLEMIHLLRQQGTLEALQQAIRVLDKPVDRFIDFALSETLEDHAPVWTPGLNQGTLPFTDTAHLIFALRLVGHNNASAFLRGLLQKPGVTPETRFDLLVAIAESGDPNALRFILNEALATEGENQLTLLNAMLNSEHRPDQGAERIFELIKSDAPATRQAVVNLIVHWKVRNAFPLLNTLLQDGEPSDQRSAITAMGALGNDAAKQALSTRVADATRPAASRMAALTELGRIDAQGNIALLQKHLPTMQGADPAPLVRTYLNDDKGPAMLQNALATLSLPSEIAAACVRTVGSSGRPLDDLIAAFTKAGKLEPLPSSLTPEQVNDLVAKVSASGNAQRGEAVYRKASIACMTCHAIGGAGGVIGPDLVSIGSSAPVDYLVESLFDPNKKIKEGYHLTTIQTRDNKVFTGMVTQKTGTETILRDAAGTLTTIPSGNIASLTSIPTSLMPQGLTAALRQDEVVDLLRFLSELGKDGAYKVGPERYVRRFKTIADSASTSMLLSQRGLVPIVQEPEGLSWAPAYSRVNGTLDPTEFPSFTYKGGQHTAFAFELDVTTPGATGFAFDRTSGLRLWVDGAEVKLLPQTMVDLEKGRHRMVLVAEAKTASKPFSIALFDVKGSKAKAQAVSGP
jgi:putative heme-binding domain-containing protein